jgi:hypothetical protein
MAKCQKGEDEMSDKIVVSASINEAYRSANFIAELMSDKILAWTVVAGPKQRSEVKGWKFERYIIIKALTCTCSTVFSSQIYTSSLNPTCWKTKAIVVTQGLADTKIFDFAIGFDNNGLGLLEELNELKSLSYSFLIDHLLAKKTPEKVFKLMGGFGSKFNLFRENGSCRLVFSNFLQDSSIDTVHVHTRWNEVHNTYEGTKICIFYKNGKRDVWPSSVINR